MRDVEIHSPTGLQFEGSRQDSGQWRAREMKRLNRLLLWNTVKLVFVIAVSTGFGYCIYQSTAEPYTKLAIMLAVIIATVPNRKTDT